MLKKSLLAAVILGALAASAGAEGEVKWNIEETKPLESVQPEFALETPGATCQAVTTEAQEPTASMILVEEWNSSRVEGVEVAYRYWRPRMCMICSMGWCRMVWC